ncbi:hypothetical protein ABEF95_002540 [Exophiala dermatitidis]
MRPSTTVFLAASATGRRSTRTRPSPPLSLDHFIQRQRVLSLWRSILRAAYRIPKSSPTRDETIAYARAEFERNKHVSELSQIRYLISTGKAEFDGMQRYIDELAAAAGKG